MICKYWSDTSLYILFVNIFRIMHYRALINSVNGKRAEKFPVVPGGHVGIIMLKFYCQSYYYKEKWSCIESQETLWFLGGQNSAWKEPRVEYIYIYTYSCMYTCVYLNIYIYTCYGSMLLGFRVMLAPNWRLVLHVVFCFADLWRIHARFVGFGFGSFSIPPGPTYHWLVKGWLFM